MCIQLLWVMRYIQLIDNADESSCVLADFLPTDSDHF